MRSWEAVLGRRRDDALSENNGHQRQPRRRLAPVSSAIDAQCPRLTSCAAEFASRRSPVRSRLAPSQRCPVLSGLFEFSAGAGPSSLCPNSNEATGQAMRVPVRARPLFSLNDTLLLRPRRPKSRGTKQELSSGTIQATRQYIRDFDSVVSASQDGAATVAAMTEKYRDLGNPCTLWLAAYTQPYDD